MIKKIENFKIDDIGYTWDQLDCFFRVQGIALESAQKDLGKSFLFLSSFYKTFRLDDFFIGNQSKLYFDFTTSFLEKHLDIVFDKKDILDLNDLTKNIIEFIDKGIPVIAPADLYSLYYYELYKENHWGHFFLVTGYDLDEKIFYIKDNLHLENNKATNYVDFVILEKIITDMAFSFNEHFIKEYKAEYLYEHIPFSSPYWILGLKNIFKDDDSQFNTKNIISIFLKSLEDLLSNKLNFSIIEIDYYNLIKNADKHSMSDEVILKQFNVETNFRQVFFDLIKYFLNVLDINRTDYEMIESEINTIEKVFNKFKNKLLVILIGKKDIDKVITDAEKDNIYSLNISFLAELKDIIYKYI